MRTNRRKFLIIFGIGLFGLILLINFQGVKLFEGTYASTNIVETNGENGSNREDYEIHVHATKPERLDYLEFSSETFFGSNSKKDEVKEKEEKDKKVVENDKNGDEKVEEKKKEDIVEPQKKIEIKEDEKTAQKQPTEKKNSSESETKQKEEKVEKQKTTSDLSYELNEFEREVVRLTNVERDKQGLSNLQVDPSLSYVAKKKSEDMVNNKYFSHTSPVYGSFFDLLDHFGIDYTYAGENLAYGFPTPEQVVSAWMNSEGHRKNILNPKYTHIGIGYVSTGHYWTMHLIRK
ncbi:CAP domain-containing protein [Fervidibacillus halotolerans]|uniref:CAP domain-containing protein n=1 Tax=Fervidibacillus halotolerans TaxID=2980027 RepID=A0A9E8M1D2_9BACI|nr:CAP domain-containing protein [Fervidibacillus halotolerans]WAA13162.1 CAP domain-containing protein [Fervidibacillus halotolerans]